MRGEHFSDLSSYRTFDRLTDHGLTQWHRAFLELGGTLDEYAVRYRLALPGMPAVDEAADDRALALGQPGGACRSKSGRGAKYHIAQASGGTGIALTQVFGRPNRAGRTAWFRASGGRS